MPLVALQDGSAGVAALPQAFQLQAKPRTFKMPTSSIPEPEVLEILLELSEYRA